MSKIHRFKPGDIFQVPIDDKAFFLQYIQDDSTLLGSNIIRVFDYSIGIDDSLELKDLPGKKISFIAHTFIKGGLKLCNWEFKGNVKIEEDFTGLMFRATDDVYSEVKKSNNWYIWKVGNEEEKIGSLKGEYKNLPYGTVYHPIDIVEWIKTGNHGFMYPE